MIDNSGRIITKIYSGKKFNQYANNLPIKTEDAVKNNNIEIDSNNKSSICLAPNLNIFGNINLEPKKAINSNNKTFNKAITIAKNEKLFAASIDNKNIAITSSISRIPTIILPCKVSNCFLSVNNLTTTAVDENAKNIPTYNASILIKPSNIAMIKPNVKNNILLTFDEPVSSHD